MSLSEVEKTPKGRTARQSMSSEEENLMDGKKPEKTKLKRLGGFFFFLTGQYLTRWP